DWGLGIAAGLRIEDGDSGLIRPLTALSALAPRLGPFERGNVVLPRRWTKMRGGFRGPTWEGVHDPRGADGRGPDHQRFGFAAIARRGGHRSDGAVYGNDRSRRLFHPDEHGIAAHLAGGDPQPQVSEVARRRAQRRRLGALHAGRPARPRS